MKSLNTVQDMTAPPAYVKQDRTLDYVKTVKRIGACAMLAMLSGYIAQLMNSAANIGVQEKNLIIVSSALTLLVVIPIIFLNIYFVSRHRASNTTAKHSPRCSYATKKEVGAWALPIVIVAALTILSWGVTHSLDQYKPIESRVAPVHVAATENT